MRKEKRKLIDGEREGGGGRDDVRGEERRWKLIDGEREEEQK